MSSFLSKLKSLVNATVRGPRRYQREPASPSVPRQNTDTIPHGAEVPKVSAAPQVEQKQTDVASPATKPPSSRMEHPRNDADRGDALEEERVVDLLKRENAHGGS
jgi:hypothetical protein